MPRSALYLSWSPLRSRHRYWNYPPAAQGAQYNNFLNISIMGGALYIFVFGGSISVDAKLSKR